MSKVLIVVDCQYDFIDGGKMGIEGSKGIMDNLASFIRENGESYDRIFLTVDWHPHSHCSFKDNGGMWDEHCIQFTIGAAIYEPIIDALKAIGYNYTVLTKGLDEDHEEYSVFKNETSCDRLVNVCDMIKADNIDFVGIAFNYCVKDSALDARKAFPNASIHILKEFCPSIGDDSVAKSLLSNNNIEIF